MARIWSKRNSYSLPVEMQNGIATLEDSLTISYLSLPGFYPSRLKTYVPLETSMFMFIAAFFMITINWEWPRYPSLGEWINN